MLGASVTHHPHTLGSKAQTFIQGRSADAPPQSPRVQHRQKAHLIDSSSLVDLRKRRHGSGRETWDQTLLHAPVQEQAGASSLENAQYCVPPSLSPLLRAGAVQPSSVWAGRRVGVQHPFQGFYRGMQSRQRALWAHPLGRHLYLCPPFCFLDASSHELRVHLGRQRDSSGVRAGMRHPGRAHGCQAPLSVWHLAPPRSSRPLLRPLRLPPRAPPRSPQCDVVENRH